MNMGKNSKKGDMVCQLPAKRQKWEQALRTGWCPSGTLPTSSLLTFCNLPLSLPISEHFHNNTSPTLWASAHKLPGWNAFLPQSCQKHATSVFSPPQSFAGHTRQWSAPSLILSQFSAESTTPPCRCFSPVHCKVLSVAEKPPVEMRMVPISCY